MKENKKRNYLEAQELYDQYKKSKEEGKCTERLGILFMDLTKHLLQSGNFRRYPEEMKQDMQSYALYKLVRSVDTVNLNMKPKQIFNYCTRAAWLAYLTEISKHYKVANLQRDLQKQALRAASFLDPRQRQQKIKEIEEFDRQVEEAKAKSAARKALKKK